MTNQIPPDQTPMTVVILGASGDLTNRKLIPALFNLCRKNKLPANMNIVGVSRTPYSHEAFRDHLREGAQHFTEGAFLAEDWADFARRIWYVSGDSSKPEDFAGLQVFLGQLEGRTANRLYYLAVAPTLYQPIVANLSASGMADQGENGIGWRRIVIEKPFGTDLPSARALNRALHNAFDEPYIYRIDHYLGKETAQNILFLRFANTIYEPIWNRTYVDHVQITVAESVTVGSRAGFYDGAGILRDMFQNHLLQLLSLVAMEPPASFKADALRNEKIKVLNAIRPISLNKTVRGQYVAYLQEKGVAAGSQTATFAAMKLYVDDWRWQGVPFYMRSGKAMADKLSEVIVVFRQPPHNMFGMLSNGSGFSSNMLRLRIQPDEGIEFRFEAKVPDSGQDTRSVEMDFSYSESFGSNAIPDSYQRLLLDAMQGDASLFIRSDEIETAWAIMDPIIKGWESPLAPPLMPYDKGSWGPASADALMAVDGRLWGRECGKADR